MKVELAHSFKIPRSPRAIATEPQARMIAVRSQREVYLFTEEGKEIARWTLPGKDRIDGMTIHPAGTYIAVATLRELLICDSSDGTIKSKPYGRWGQYSFCEPAYSACGSFLYIVAPEEDTNNPCVQVLNTADLTVIDECQLLLDEECGYSFVFHPNGKQGFIDAGAGQDGIWAYRFSLSKTGLSVEHLPELDWRPVNSIRPNGKEILTSSMMDGCLQRRNLRSLDVLEEIEDELGVTMYQAYYFDNKHILARLDEEEALGLLHADTLEVDKLRYRSR